MRDANEALHDVRQIGDLVVSAFFERDKPKDRQTLRSAYAGRVEHWLTQRDSRLVAAADLHPALAPFHWKIEFPEVFTRANGGFDGFVGNPPFLGGTLISGAQRSGYLSWLKAAFAGSGNRMDLCAYFFRLAFQQLRSGGAAGLVATNTIAQGDTRKGGVTTIVAAGATLFNAVRRIRWPGDAAVVVTTITFVRGDYFGLKVLDGQPVRSISPFLLAADVRDEPRALRANANQVFEGVKPYAQGFLFDDRDEDANPTSLMRELIASDPRNAQLIVPYIGGEEVNESPDHSPRRWAINFGRMTLEEARRWPDLLEICERRVKPDRATKAPDVAKCPWWQYWRPRRELYKAIAGKDRVLVITRHSETAAMAFLTAGLIYSEALDIFALSSLAAFALLQCRAHECWARLLGGSIKDDLRYTPSDCFETFPFPLRWESSQNLERIGREYYDFRAALMVRNNEGLTKTYNRFHDPEERAPDILKLRDMHAGMDRAVLDAYGWTVIQPKCEFVLDYVDEEDDTPGKASKKKKPYRYRWPDDIRDDVLGRLLELNAKRAEEEKSASAAAGAVKSIPRKKHKSNKIPGTPLLD